MAKLCLMYWVVERNTMIVSKRRACFFVRVARKRRQCSVFMLHSLISGPFSCLLQSDSYVSTVR